MKIYIETLGCPKNMTDSAKLEGLLYDAGHRTESEPSLADVLIVNTCGFIDDAKEESIDRILALGDCKKNGAILVASGCLTQRFGNDLLKAMPEIDILIGVNDYPDLPRLLDEHKKGEKVLQCGLCGKEYEEWGNRKPENVTCTAYLKIAEGCDNICAYCVIPSIRGGYRSRNQEDILAEAESLAAAGCRELILVAQDVTAYGIDLYGKYALADLLEKLCRISGICWIRLLYCYEDRITDELIRVMAKEEKICHYLDIPIQHASDRVLRSMNRRSTRASIEATIQKLRREIPDIHIRTTLITGFPGETKEDFHELYDFVKETGFDRLGVFAYSKEEGTPAAAMKEQVPKKTKTARRNQIMELQRQISLANNRAMIGLVVEVLVEEKESDGTLIGRTRYDAPEIDFSILFRAENEELTPGDLILVKITDAFDYDLVGEKVVKLL